MIRFIVMLIVTMTPLLMGSDVAARQAYLNKNYAQSTPLFLQQTIQNPHYFSHHYNVASSYFRTGDFVQAKRHILKALRVFPNHQDAKHNLNIINQQLIDKELFFKVHWGSIGGVSYQIMFGVSLVLSIPLLMVFILMMKQNRDALKRVGAIAGFMWLIWISAIGLMLNQLPHYGLVTANKVAIYSGPSLTQNILFYAHEGAEFKELKQAKKWANIQFSNGLKGWVELKHTGAI